MTDTHIEYPHNVENDSSHSGQNESTIEDSFIDPAAILNNACTATRIMEKRRQLMDLEDALDAQKDEFARKVETLKRREDALRKKDLRLQESLIKFNKFLQENENKRTRAMKRCADEAKACEAKDKEINSLRDLLESKTLEEQELGVRLNKNKRYLDYLKMVVEYAQGSSDDFLEIQDILDRYQTLKNTNNNLLQQMQQNTKEHENRRFDYVQYVKASNNEMLNKNNKIAGLQKRLEAVTIESHNIESLNDGSTRNATEMTSDLSQIFVVIENILERFDGHDQDRGNSSTIINKGNFLPTNSVQGYGDDSGKRTAVLKNLEKISEYIVDYKSIADKWESNQSSS